MPTFTQKFEDFLDNNHPGGYISTSTNISDSDLDARITQNINNKGFLTSNSHLPWNQIDNKPTIFSGNYNDLINKPTIFSGDYNDLINKPSVFSGDYNDLTNKPAIFSGDYEDLIHKPSIFSGDYNDLINKPTIITNYNQLSNIPQLDALEPNFSVLNLADVAVSGQYDDLQDKPAFAAVAMTGDYYDLLNYPSFFWTIDFSENDNLNIRNLFSEDKIISNYHLIDYDEDSTLNELLNGMITYYQGNTLIVKIKTLAGIFTLLDLQSHFLDNDDFYYQLLFAPHIFCTYDPNDGGLNTNSITINYYILIIYPTTHQLVCKIVNIN